MKGISGGCEEEYGTGFYFWGKAYNRGLDGENLIDYEGYVNTYHFNCCNCEFRGGMDNIICHEKDDFPYVVMECTPKLNEDLNIIMMRHGALFDIGFTDILPNGNLIPIDEKDIINF